MSVEGQTVGPPWLGVEVRHLAALAAIDRQGSFSGAANELGYVQSAISQQIARLERAVGTRLIERKRGHRSVTLTPAGSLLACHARELLREFQAARLDLAVATDDGPHVLQVGLAPGLAHWLMPALMQQPLLECDWRPRFSEADSLEELLRLVEYGDLDIGVACSRLDAIAFESRRLVEDHYVVLVPSASALGRRRAPVDPASLAGYPVIAPTWSPEFAPVEQQLHDHGLSLAGAMRSSATYACHAFVASGHGVALLPRLSVNVRDRSVAPLELAMPSLRRTVSVFWQRHRRSTERLEEFALLAIAGVEAATSKELALAA